MSVEISEEIDMRAGWFDHARRPGLWLVEQIAGQKDRLFYWCPIFLSFGIGFYFSLPVEPPLVAGAGMLLCLIVAAWLTPVERRPLVMLCMLAGLGFFSAQVRTRMVYTPILQREMSAAMVSGRIENLEGMENGQGSRALLSNVEIEKLLPEQTPRNVRISIRKDEGLHVGQRIRVLAGINPPSPPVAPGAFDFQRYMYFQGIGAMGFAFKQPEIIGAPDVNQNWIERVREAIDKRIDASMPYPQAAIAMALTTGRRAAIDADVNDAITASGLAHILSISGLHIGMVATLIFFVVRFLMVCVPGMALHHPVKKYAAGFAFAGAVFYTMLAGAPVPAVRSLIMVGVALLAIVLDRSPLSMRLVAAAAFVVLLLVPESLVGASFQMSFGAVAGLVLVFDYLRPQFTKWNANAGMMRRAALYLFSVCLTTVVATVATAPLTVFHFQQLSIYGVIANALAVPLSGFVIMPAGLVALLAMPLGLEHWPLVVMAWGVEGMVVIAKSVAALPYALVKLPEPSNVLLSLMAVGIVLFFLVRGRLKFMALMPLVAGVLCAMSARAPDILVSPGFELAAVKDGDALYVSNVRREKFIREKWESSYGWPPGVAQAWPQEGSVGPLRCDEMACRVEMKGQHVSFLRQSGALAEECAWADAVLAFDPLKNQKCEGKIVIDRFDAKYDGSHALWLSDGGIKVENAEEERGARPWSSLNKKFSGKNFSGKSASSSPAGPGF